MRCLAWLATALLLTAGTTGCAPCRNARCGSCPPTLGIDADVALTPTPRGQLAVDVSAVESFATVRKASGAEDPPQQYGLLKEQECQCLAAAGSSLAGLLEREAHWIGCKPGADRKKAVCATALQQNMLLLVAVEDRNRSAGMALEVYYRLAEAEANRDLLARSLAEIDQAQTDFAQLKERGLRAAADGEKLQRQKLDLLKQKVELEQSLAQLNGHLQQLLRLQPEAVLPLWPEVELRVVPEFVNVDTALADGLARRPDLALAALLHDSVSAGNLPAIRSGLGMINLLLGSAPGKAPLLRRMFGQDPTGGEMAVREEQFAQLLIDRQHAAVAEIRQAAAAVNSQVQQVALAKELLAHCKQRVQDLREKQPADGVTAFDITAAQLEVLRAETQLLHEVVGWKIARAKLRQNLGLLSDECGYPLPAADCCPAE